MESSSMKVVVDVSWQGMISASFVFDVGYLNVNRHANRDDYQKDLRSRENLYDVNNSTWRVPINVDVEQRDEHSKDVVDPMIGDGSMNQM